MLLLLLMLHAGADDYDVANVFMDADDVADTFQYLWYFQVSKNI